MRLLNVCDLKNIFVMSYPSNVIAIQGSVHKLREGGGMGKLRGDLKIFYTERGGPEMLPEHRGENLKYLTSKNIKGSFLQAIRHFNH